jgi:hypothetical protein
MHVYVIFCSCDSPALKWSQRSFENACEYSIIKLCLQYGKNHAKLVDLEMQNIFSVLQNPIEQGILDANAWKQVLLLSCRRCLLNTVFLNELRLNID